MATEISLSETLFTPAEHAILAKWLNVKPPPEALGVDIAEATSNLDFAVEPWEIYTRADAAVAHILIKCV